MLVLKCEQIKKLVRSVLFFLNGKMLLMWIPWYLLISYLIVDPDRDNEALPTQASSEFLRLSCDSLEITPHDKARFFWPFDHVIV